MQSGRTGLSSFFLSRTPLMMSALPTSPTGLWIWWRGLTETPMRTQLLWPMSRRSKSVPLPPHGRLITMPLRRYHTGCGLVGEVHFCFLLQSGHGDSRWGALQCRPCGRRSDRDSASPVFGDLSRNFVPPLYSIQEQFCSLLLLLGSCSSRIDDKKLLEVDVKKLMFQSRDDVPRRSCLALVDSVLEVPSLSPADYRWQDSFSLGCMNFLYFLQVVPTILTDKFSAKCSPVLCYEIKSPKLGLIFSLIHTNHWATAQLPLNRPLSITCTWGEIRALLLRLRTHHPLRETFPSAHAPKFSAEFPGV